MPTVRKTNRVRRQILKSHFQQVGVKDQDAVAFGPENDFTAEVSDKAAKHLTENDVFEVVETSKQKASKSSASSKNS